VFVRDDGVYEFLCNNNHKTVTIIQQPKFEILFEIGACALVDGYFREAVSSFAASLERFYEFAIRFVLHELKVDTESVGQSWKKISKQSERQLGAFIFVWLTHYKVVPKTLNENKGVRFRNDVIHNGKIPTQQECIEFGNSVIATIVDNVKYMYKDDPDGYRYNFEFFDRAMSRIADAPLTTMSIPTILGRGNIIAGGERLRLETYLDNLRRQRVLGLR